jgi:hypothetical protein
MWLTEMKLLIFIAFLSLGVFCESLALAGDNKIPGFCAVPLEKRESHFKFEKRILNFFDPSLCGENQNRNIQCITTQDADEINKIVQNLSLGLQNDFKTRLLQSREQLPDLVQLPFCLNINREESVIKVEKVSQTTVSEGGQTTPAKPSEKKILDVEFDFAMISYPKMCEAYEGFNDLLKNNLLKYKSDTPCQIPLGEIK